MHNKVVAMIRHQVWRRCATFRGDSDLLPWIRTILRHGAIERVRRPAHEETPLAVFFGKEAVAQIQRERSHFVGKDRRFDVGFLRDKVAAYRSVADWLMESGRIDEGLAVLQLMKTEELSDFGVRDAALASDRAALLTDEEAALKDRYAVAVQADATPGSELSRLTSLEETGKISVAERERLRVLLAGKGKTEEARAGRIEQLLQGTAGATADDRARQTLAAPALARAARSFGPDTAFAVYLLTDRRLRILVTARGAQEELSVPIEAAQLQRDIGHFLDDIVQRCDVTLLAEKLYDVIARGVDEFAARQRVHRLALWLDGSLRYVPIAALRDGSGPPLDKYVIQVYTPAPGSSDARMPAHAAQWRVRGLGVT